MWVRRSSRRGPSPSWSTAGYSRTRAFPAGTPLLADPVTVEAELRPGSPGVARCPERPAGAKTVEIWLPHNEQTELLALRTDAPVEPVRAERPVWLHHGSSISHGSNADGPT